MGESITVEPEYTKSGIEASRTFKNRVSNAGAEYPLAINGHSVQVKYLFENDHRGLLKLMGLGYYCNYCGVEQMLEGDALWEYKNRERREARKYLIGYFCESLCDQKV